MINNKNQKLWKASKQKKNIIKKLKKKNYVKILTLLS